MGINELGHSVDSIFLDSTMASNCFQEHWQITDWLCVQVRELSVHSSKWRPSGKNVQRCKGQYLYEFLIFYPLRPMSRADFTQPRSFCLLFGDPLPPTICRRHISMPPKDESCSHQHPHFASNCLQCCCCCTHPVQGISNNRSCMPLGGHTTNTVVSVLDSTNFIRWELLKFQSSLIITN